MESHIQETCCENLRVSDSMTCYLEFRTMRFARKAKSKKVSIEKSTSRVCMYVCTYVVAEEYFQFVCRFWQDTTRLIISRTISLLSL